MKYTRYDLKKENKTKSFVFIMLIILCLAFIIGTVASKIFLSETDKSAFKDTQNTSQASNVNSGKTIVDGSSVKFVAIQGGIYKDKNNAEKEKEILIKYGTPFTVNDGGEVRVFLGIYSSDAAKAVTESLKKEKVDNSVKDFIIKKSNLCNAEIIEIINANLQILNKFSDKSVEYIKTDDLKKWCDSLENLDKSDENFAVLNDLKEHVKSLKDTLSRDESSKEYIYIYSKLKSIK
ncbi:SPOR domain-containing protein [Clostridium sp. cel8]|jgi:flagellar basal body-associated protein FliL|uniref:SPOR domain-containing protein n=1 Tax=unclassified Clostridium TaxID=2614128 RepID=UPI0015F671F3|nr:SPOR domain-containing protein [Clostridium sp. cel8]MBA5849934.1 SPOR domain-containing protein [Clostridium sp. cel8]